MPTQHDRKPLVNYPTATKRRLNGAPWRCDRGSNGDVRTSRPERRWRILCCSLSIAHVAVQTGLQRRLLPADRATCVSGTEVPIDLSEACLIGSSGTNGLPGTEAGQR